MSSKHPQPYNSYGNGSAMRVSPCGLIAQSLEEALDLAKQSAEVTHNHPEGIKGAQATAAAVYLAKSGASKEEILSGHGFGSHRENYAAERFAESYLENHRSAAVLAFDLPCHGKDRSKNLTTERCDTYLRVVIRYLKKQLTADMIFGYAIDFSGYLFLRYIHAHENPFLGIALLCPALNAARDLKEAYKERNPKTKYAKIFRNSEMFGRYNKIEEILSLDYTAFSDSLLILHGTEDELTPVKTVKSFADKNQICFIPIEQGDHRFLDPAKMNIAIHRITEHFDSLNLRLSLSNKVKSEEILQPIR